MTMKIIQKDLSDDFKELLHKVQSDQDIDHFAIQNLASNLNMPKISQELNEGKGINFTLVLTGYGEQIQGEFFLKFLRRYFPHAEFESIKYDDSEIYNKNQKKNIFVFPRDHREKYAQVGVSELENTLKNFISPSMIQLKVLNKSYVKENSRKALKKCLFENIELPEELKALPILISADFERFYEKFKEPFLYFEVQGSDDDRIVFRKCIEEGDLTEKLYLNSLGGNLVLRYLYSIADWTYVQHANNKLEPVSLGIPVFTGSMVNEIESNSNFHIDQYLINHRKVFLEDDINISKPPHISFSDNDQKAAYNTVRKNRASSEQLIEASVKEIVQIMYNIQS